MRPDALNDLLKKQPFQPFRMFLSHGKSFEVRHPELAVMGKNLMFLGHPVAETPEPLFERFGLIDLIHINRIDPILQNPGGPNNGQVD